MIALDWLAFLLVGRRRKTKLVRWADKYVEIKWM